MLRDGELVADLALQSKMSWLQLLNCKHVIADIVTDRCNERAGIQMACAAAAAPEKLGTLRHKLSTREGRTKKHQL